MTKIKYLSLIAILVGLSFFLGKNQNKIQNSNQNKQPSEAAEVTPHLTGIWVGGNLVQIGEEEIFINPCDGECTRPTTHLDKNTYPNLFKTYDKFTRIEVQGIHDISGKDFVFFINNVPDHGGYATVYGIIVDPSTQSVVLQRLKN